MRRPFVYAGSALVLAGATLLGSWLLTPAALVGHPDPHPPATGLFAQPAGEIERGVEGAIALAAPAATPPAAAPAPAPRSGLWIESPDLDLALPIARGDGSDSIPYWRALIYPGTPTPGKPGNSYLYAHGYWGMFGNLLYARPGDRVIVHDYHSGDSTTFRVSRVVGREPYTDVSWMQARSAAPMLTLQTCLGTGLKSDRWIVIATR